MDAKQYINEEVSKLHTKTILEAELKKINKELATLKEGENKEEQKSYERNMYGTYEKDLEEVVKILAEACNKLETSALKQDAHMKAIPEVATRIDEGKKHKEVILEIFREVKKAKLAAERKLYEIR